MKIRNSYLGSITLLASGSMLSQIIGFLGSIFMTRLYTEGEIGLMATIVAVSGIFAPIINGRFDYAIVKENNEELLIPVVFLSLLIGFLFSVIVSIGSIGYFECLDLTMSSLVAAFFVFSILIITSFTNVCKSFNNHVGDYKTMTWVVVSRRLAEEVSMVIFGLLKLGGLGLLVSRIIGQYFGMRQEVKNIKNYFSEIFKVNKEQLRIVFYLHRRQLYFSSPGALFNAASYSLISLFIGSIYGLDILGVYTISYAVLGLPLSVISGNVSKVYFNQSSKDFAFKGDFMQCTKKTLFILVLFASFLFLVMYYLFPILVPIIYGDNYSIAGVFIKILSPMFAIRFIASSLITSFVIVNKQLAEMIIQLLFVMTILFISFVCKNISIQEYLMWISITYSLVYLFCLFLEIKYSMKTV